jgi:hypothetical protein
VIDANRLSEQRSKALYEMLFKEIESTHSGDGLVLPEITRSLHETFGRQFEDQKTAE